MAAWYLVYNEDGEHTVVQAPSAQLAVSTLSFRSSSKIHVEQMPVSKAPTGLEVQAFLRKDPELIERARQAYEKSLLKTPTGKPIQHARAAFRAAFEQVPKTVEDGAMLAEITRYARTHWSETAENDDAGDELEPDAQTDDE